MKVEIAIRGILSKGKCTSVSKKIPYCKKHENGTEYTQENKKTAVRELENKISEQIATS